MDNAHGARLGGAVRLIPPRSDRLQVCLSPSEKARLAEEARRGGYETLSDYVRAKTLGEHKDGHAQ